MHASECVRACVRACVRVRVCVHECVCAYMRFCVHVQAFTPVYIHVGGVPARDRALGPAFMSTCIRLHACVSAFAYVRVRICARFCT